jgi:hypothetical protein
MLRTKLLTLSSVPQELTIDDAVDGPNHISIQNVSSSTKHIFLGNGNVSLTNYGRKLDPQESFETDLGPEDKIFAVGDEGSTVAVFIIEK